MNGTRTTIEADGIPYFEGEVTPPGLSFGGGGGGSQGAILGIRWDAATHAVQVTYDWTDWVEAIAYLPWDA